MKRYIRTEETVADLTEEEAIAKGRAYAKQIRALFKSEDINFKTVREDGSWEEEIFVVAEVYGDWKNNNQRAVELIEDRMHPDNIDGRELDYNESSLAKRFAGTDSAVMRIYCTWYE